MSWPPSRNLHVQEAITLKRLIPLLLTAILTLGMAPARTTAAAPFPDLVDHWSEGDVLAAVATGWVNGYPDGLFRPSGTITRAEFVKLLAAATYLSPGSDRSNSLIALAAAYAPAQPEALLPDLDGHWLATQGWLQPAVSFGLIVPADYEKALFEPNRAITRQEIAVMVVRALGRVYPALYQPPGDLGFTDQERLPAWLRGYVKEAVGAGVLRGYPDGSFGGDQQATRAEAVIMVSRALAAMSVGADPAIQVFVKVRPDQEPVPVPLPVPARFIDDRIYLPARSVLEVLSWLRSGQAPTFAWDPVAQRLIHTLAFTAGSDQTEQQVILSSVTRKMVAPARMAFGELLVPVRMADSDASPFFKAGSLFWEPLQKRLTIYALTSYD